MRYDFKISIDNVSTFELLCEAYERKKSDMIDLIIENFAKGNLKLKHHVQSKMRKRTIAFYKIGRQMLNLYRYFSEQRLKFQFLRRLREQRCALDGCRSKPPFAVPALLGQGAKMDVTTKELSDILSLTQRQYLRSGKRRRDSQDRAQ